MELLLLADEQESMVNRYLADGDMFVLYVDCIAVVVAVVVMAQDGECEIKNLAVGPTYQRQGYGRKMVEHIENCYKKRCHTIYVGTGDSPLTIPFYEACGFIYSHTVKDFFIDNYDHPIIEAGRRLVDMVYLKKELDSTNITRSR